MQKNYIKNISDLFIQTVDRSDDDTRDAAIGEKTSDSRQSDSTAAEGCRMKQDWAAVLEKVTEQLHSLNRNSEEEFLFAGQQLQAFAMEAREIYSLIQGAVEIFSGRGVQNLIIELEELLARVQRYFSFSNDETARQTVFLEKVFTSTAQLQASLGVFYNIIKRLSVLGISTRIENARLTRNRSSFENLVDDVDRLGNKIKVKADDLDRQFSLIDSKRGREFEYILSIKKEQTSSAENIITHIAEGIENLQNERKESADTAELILERSHTVSVLINDVVVSLQFHDITRQVLEHVNEALKECREKLETDDDSDASRFKELFDICLIQRCQMEAARDQIVDAVSKLIESMYHIGEHVVGMVRESALTSQGAGAEKRSSISIVKQHVSDVLAGLKTVIEGEHDLYAVLDSLFSVVSSVGGFVKDIHQIGEEVELVAMNGLVSASRLGEEGRALSVLADEIHKLSNHTRSHISNISNPLSDIADNTRKIIQRNAEKDVREHAKKIVDELGMELDNVLVELEDINSTIMGIIEQVYSRSETLNDNLMGFIGQVGIHTYFKESINQSIDAVDAVLRGLVDKGLVSEERISSEYVEGLQKKYTMHKEREVHAALTGGSAFESGNAEAVAEYAGTGEGDLGDNIELF